MRTLTQEQIDELQAEANAAADFRPSRVQVVDLIEEVRLLRKVASGEHPLTWDAGLMDTYSRTSARITDLDSSTGGL